MEVLEDFVVVLVNMGQVEFIGLDLKFLSLVSHGHCRMDLVSGGQKFFPVGMVLVLSEHSLNPDQVLNGFVPINRIQA